MKKTILMTLAIVFIAFPAMASDGMVNVQSIFKEKGMTVFNRIKHSEAAAAVGIELRNTELILFGNPKVGSPLMKCQQSAAIDLPQKALIWEDDKATVWISYNNPRYLEKRHNITGCEEVISKIERALAGIAESTATK